MGSNAWAQSQTIDNHRFFYSHNSLFGNRNIFVWHVEEVMEDSHSEEYQQ